MEQVKKCPVCGDELTENMICGSCGYAEAEDFEIYPSIGRLSAEILPVSERERQLRPAAGSILNGGLNRTLKKAWGKFERTKIRKVIFTDSLRETGKETADVSMKGDGSILAWKEKTTLMIGSEGPIVIRNASQMFSSFTKLETIDWGNNVRLDTLTGVSKMFANCRSLQELDLRLFEVGKCKSFSEMFSGCESLTELDVSGFQTGSATNMENMFCGCSKLNKLDVSGFDTGKCTSMIGMFQDCRSLTSLNVKGFATGNCNRMSQMFYGCSGLKTLDVSGFQMQRVQWMNRMFAGCTSLERLDLRKWQLLPKRNAANKNLFAIEMFQGCVKLRSITGRAETPKKKGILASLFSTETPSVDTRLLEEFYKK